MEQSSEISNDKFDESLSINILESSNDVIQNEQDVSYMNAELVRYVLLHMPHTDDAKQELFISLKAYTKTHTGYSQTVSEDFAANYTSESAVRWYTESSFLFEKINKALREQDVDFIYGIRYYLVDLHDQLQAGHLNFNTTETLYRGSGMESIEFDKLKENIGKLMYFGQFLSTSMDEETAKGFSWKPIGGKKSILFHINFSPCARINASKDNPIASIEQLSVKQFEHEVLFSPGCVFRITSVIEPKMTDKIWHVHLQLTTDRDKHLKELCDYIKKDIHPDITPPTQLATLAKLARRFDQFDDAIKWYHLAIEDREKYHDDRMLMVIYIDLTLIYRQKKQYKNAMDSLNKAEKSGKNAHIPSDSVLHRRIINSRALIHTHMGNLKAAAFCYAELLEMERQALDIDDRDRATTFSNLAGFYLRLGHSTGAMALYTTALELQKKVLPNNHPEIARTYSNMSVGYGALKSNQKAKEYAELARKIQTKSLSDHHHSVGYTEYNLGIAHNKLGNYDEAYSSLEAAQETLLQTFPADDPEIKDIKTVLKDIPLK